LKRSFETKLRLKAERLAERGLLERDTSEKEKSKYTSRALTLKLLLTCRKSRLPETGGQINACCTFLSISSLLMKT